MARVLAVHPTHSVADVRKELAVELAWLNLGEGDEQRLVKRVHSKAKKSAASAGTGGSMEPVRATSPPRMSAKRLRAHSRQTANIGSDVLVLPKGGQPGATGLAMASKLGEHGISLVPTELDRGDALRDSQDSLTTHNDTEASAAPTALQTEEAIELELRPPLLR